jgi:tRNA-intron lyase
LRSKFNFLNVWNFIGFEDNDIKNKNKEKENERENNICNNNNLFINNTELDLNKDLTFNSNTHKNKDNEKACDREIFFSELKESNKYKVYKDLKERGYYITSGLKFGSDFLLYNGTLFYFI